MKILIEMDGPLVDVQVRLYEVHKRVLAELSLPKLDRAEFWRLSRRGAPAKDFVRGGTSRHVQAYQQRFLELSECDELLEHDILQPEATETLQALKSLGQPVLITLRLNRPGAQSVLNRLKLSDHFWQVVGLSQASGRRVDQLRELAGEVRRLVVAASSEAVVIASREADLPVVGIANGPRTPQLLRRAGADVVFDDLDELAIQLASSSEAVRRAGVLPIES